MDFSYQSSEKMYMEAFRLHYWRLMRKLVWIIAGAILIYAASILVMVLEGLAVGVSASRTLASNPMTADLILPLSIVFVFIIVFVLPRNRVARLYRRNPARDRIVNVSVTAEHFETKIEGLGGSCFNWPFYKSWYEGKNLIVLVLQTGQYQPIPKTGLTPAQLAELRGILAMALPRK